MTNLKNIFFIFEKSHKLPLFILILFYSFIYYLSSTITLYLFTPTLFVMTIILSSLMIWVINIISEIYKGHKDDTTDIQCIFQAIGYCTLYIACIIFNEIIICNFWKMDYNTQKEIEQRGIEDLIENNEKIISNDESIISLS